MGELVEGWVSELMVKLVDGWVINEWTNECVVTSLEQDYVRFFAVQAKVELVS